MTCRACEAVRVKFASGVGACSEAVSGSSCYCSCWCSKAPLFHRCPAGVPFSFLRVRSVLGTGQGDEALLQPLAECGRAVENNEPGRMHKTCFMREALSPPSLPPPSPRPSPPPSRDPSSPLSRGFKGNPSSLPSRERALRVLQEGLKGDPSRLHLRAPGVGAEGWGRKPRKSGGRRVGLEGWVPKGGMEGPKFSAFLSLFVLSSLSGGLLVELWPRFKAVAHPKCAFRLLWGHVVRAPAACRPPGFRSQVTGAVDCESVRGSSNGSQGIGILR